MEVVDFDEFFAEGQAPNRVPVLIHVWRVDGDPHRVRQHHHHHTSLARLARESHLKVEEKHYVYYFCRKPQNKWESINMCRNRYENMREKYNEET